MHSNDHRLRLRMSRECSVRFRGGERRRAESSMKCVVHAPSVLEAAALGLANSRRERLAP